MSDFHLESKKDENAVNTESSLDLTSAVRLSVKKLTDLRIDHISRFKLAKDLSAKKNYQINWSDIARDINVPLIRILRNKKHFEKYLDKSNKKLDKARNEKLEDYKKSQAESMAKKIALTIDTINKIKLIRFEYILQHNYQHDFRCAHDYQIRIKDINDYAGTPTDQSFEDAASLPEVKTYLNDINERLELLKKCKIQIHRKITSGSATKKTKRSSPELARTSTTDEKDSSNSHLSAVETINALMDQRLENIFQMTRFQCYRYSQSNYHIKISEAAHAVNVHRRQLETSDSSLGWLRKYLDQVNEDLQQLKDIKTNLLKKDKESVLPIGESNKNAAPQHSYSKAMKENLALAVETINTIKLQRFEYILQHHDPKDFEDVFDYHISLSEITNTIKASTGRQLARGVIWPEIRSYLTNVNERLGQFKTKKLEICRHGAGRKAKSFAVLPIWVTEPCNKTSAYTADSAYEAINTLMGQCLSRITHISQLQSFIPREYYSISTAEVANSVGVSIDKLIGASPYAHHVKKYLSEINEDLKQLKDIKTELCRQGKDIAMPQPEPYSYCYIPLKVRQSGNPEEIARWQQIGEEKQKKREQFAQEIREMELKRLHGFKNKDKSRFNIKSERAGKYQYEADRQRKKAEYAEKLRELELQRNLERNAQNGTAMQSSTDTNPPQLRLNRRLYSYCYIPMKARQSGNREEVAKWQQIGEEKQKKREQFAQEIREMELNRQRSSEHKSGNHQKSKSESTSKDQYEADRQRKKAEYAEKLRELELQRNLERNAQNGTERHSKTNTNDINEDHSQDSLQMRKEELAKPNKATKKKNENNGSPLKLAADSKRRDNNYSLHKVHTVINMLKNACLRYIYQHDQPQYFTKKSDYQITAGNVARNLGIVTIPSEISDYLAEVNKELTQLKDKRIEDHRQSLLSKKD